MNQKKCPSGVVTIHEKNIYDEEAVYQALFIAENDNTGEIILKIYSDENEEERKFNKDTKSDIIKATAFSISEIKDALDPYCIIKVVNTNTSRTEYLAADENLSTKAWSDDGTYEISLVNRLGYTYSVKIEIENSTTSSLTFKGIGTEQLNAIITQYGSKDVALPKLSRYGYQLMGFKDDDGQMYSGQIDKIKFRGEKLLTAVWEAKKFKISLVDQDGNVLKSDTLEFGQKYELSEPDLGNHFQFLGWTENGKMLDEKTYTLNKESDITLVAKAEEIKPNAPIIEEEQESSKPWGVIAIVGGLGIGMAAFVVLRKKSKQPTNK